MIDLNKMSKNELSMLQIQVKYELQRRKREDYTAVNEAIHKFHVAYNNLVELLGPLSIKYKSEYAPCANGGVIYLLNWDDFVFEYEDE